MVSAIWDAPPWARGRHACSTCNARGALGAALSVCPRCGSARCAACTGDPCPGCPILDALHRVLDGERPRSTDLGARKMHSFVLDLGAERDVLFSGRGVEVRALGSPHRHSYFARLGPETLGRMLDACGIQGPVGEPIVASYAGGPHPMLTAGRKMREQLVWILPHLAGVELRLRAPAALRCLRAIPIPTDGPLALPPQWEAPLADSNAARMMTFAEPGHACPYCTERRTSFRITRDDRALVCPTCGRSFDLPAPSGS